MQTFAKKRLEIVIEAPVLKRLTDLLEREGVHGYLVQPTLSGLGPEGPWSREGQVGDAGRMHAVVCIVDEAELDHVLEAVFALVRRQIGHVAISDCRVVRPDRF